MPTRLWVLTNAPSPYQVELLNDAACREDMELSVRYMRSGSPAGRSVDDAPGYDVVVMWGSLPQWCRDELRLHPRAIWEVIRGRHDVYVLSGLYTSPTFFWCAVFAVLLRRKYVLWMERPHTSRASGSWLKRRMQSIKRAYLRWLIRHASAVWCIGSQAEREYQAFAGGNLTPRVLPYCCRTSRFQLDRLVGKVWRERHDLVDRCVLLFSGQLIHRKGVDTLLKAFAPAAKQHSDAVLMLLGDGPSRTEYEALAKQLGIESHVRFLGRRSQGELPGWFAAADVFVFPSRHDGWAVVINEACAAGLPVIASSQTGAAFDLVREGVNGFVLDCEDVEGWTRHMTWCLEHRDELSVMGGTSRNLVEPFSSEAGAARLVEYAHELMPQSQAIRELQKT